MDSHQFIEIPALLFFLGSLLFCGTFYNFWPQEISPQGYTITFLVIAVVLMLMPIPVLYPNARWWMARSFLRVITGGLVKVSFRDFFLGDEL
jgi:membrane protein YdbS with pleckstrin-like domain